MYMLGQILENCQQKQMKVRQNDYIIIIYIIVILCNA